MRGERLEFIGYIALGVALIAVVLVGFVPEKGAVRPSAKGLIMAVGSGIIAIGAFLIIIDAAPDDSGIIPLIANRATNSAIMFAVLGILILVAAQREWPGRGSTGRGIRFALVCGVVDVVANFGLLVGVRIGELTRHVGAHRRCTRPARSSWLPSCSRSGSRRTGMWGSCWPSRRPGMLALARRGFVASAAGPALRDAAPGLADDG